MQTAQVRKHGTTDEMGIGWHLRTVGGVGTMAHGGTLNGHCLLLQLVPSRNLAFTVLTNHQDGWRLVQDVEHAILRRYAGVSLASGQAIGHRGVNEAMTFHAQPKAVQPALEEYEGLLRASARGHRGGATARGSAGRRHGRQSARCAARVLRTRYRLCPRRRVSRHALRVHPRRRRRRALDSRQRAHRAQEQLAAGLTPGSLAGETRRCGSSSWRRPPSGSRRRTRWCSRRSGRRRSACSPPSAACSSGRPRLRPARFRGR